VKIAFYKINDFLLFIARLQPEFRHLKFYKMDGQNVLQTGEVVKLGFLIRFQAKAGKESE